MRVRFPRLLLHAPPAQNGVAWDGQGTLHSAPTREAKIEYKITLHTSCDSTKYNR